MRIVLKTTLLAFGAVALAAPAMAQQAPRASGYAALAQWPDWSGVWSPGVGAGSRTTPTPPKYTPAAQKIVDAFNAELKKFIGSPEHIALVEPIGFGKDYLPEKTTAELCAGE